MRESSESPLVKELEGKHFIFEKTDHDINYEGSCLVLMKLKNGKLIGIAGYERFAEELEFKGPEITEGIIKGMKKSGIRQVYSIFAPGTGNVLGWDLYEDNPKELDDRGAINEWTKYDSICRESDLYDQITKEGIKIIQIDLENDKIIE